MNVVSYCLYGQKRLYQYGAIQNAKAVKEYYPGWQMRVYFHPQVPQETLAGLHEHGVELIPCQRHVIDKWWLCKFERFRPCSDSDVDIMVCRDIDSRIGERELAAVHEWLASDKDFHIMRDNRHHRDKVLAGMWGSRNHILPDMVKWMDKYAESCPHNPGNFDRGREQYFLARFVYPHVVNRAMIHASFHRHELHAHPVPGKRTEENFIAKTYRLPKSS